MEAARFLGSLESPDFLEKNQMVAPVDPALPVSSRSTIYEFVCHFQAFKRLWYW